MIKGKVFAAHKVLLYKAAAACAHRQTGCLLVATWVTRNDIHWPLLSMVYNYDYYWVDRVVWQEQLIYCLQTAKPQKIQQL